MIEINNKFNIGDEVYTIKAEPLEYTCDLCKGNGFIVYEEKKIRCPHCHGLKTISSDNLKVWRVIHEKLIVSSIKANINEYSCIIRYNLSGLKRAEQNVFKTFDEAQERCDILNIALPE